MVRAHQGGIKYCYETELMRQPKLGGKVVVSWRIDLDGRVQSARIRTTSMNNTSVEACLVRQIGRWRFPKPAGTMVDVSYPFLKGYKVELIDGSPATRRASRAPRSTSRASTPTATSRRRSASTGWCASRPSTPTRAATPPSPRSTSIPDMDDSIEVEIKDEDLKIDTFRSGGAGGQHVNKTESAVRITHLPTRHRGQLPERALAAQEQGAGDAACCRPASTSTRCRRRRRRRPSCNAQKKADRWGSQIRSYVLAPYRLVSDHRTELKVGNVDAVLDGDLDQFIHASERSSTTRASMPCPRIGPSSSPSTPRTRPPSPGAMTTTRASSTASRSSSWSGASAPTASAC